MLSIITAIRNGLPVNKIFYRFLKRYTQNDFELIIIDNASSDGSGNFFRQMGARVITNADNFSYPYTQNQGIDVATGDYLCFLNNDILVSPSWDQHLLDTLTHHHLDLVSASGIENTGDPSRNQAIARRWKRIKYPLNVLFGSGEANLLRMHRWMYGNWEKFTQDWYRDHQGQVAEGIVGNNVLMTRKGLQAVGRWDERIQGADFDLFMRAKKRSLEFGDILPCHIAMDVFIHHFIRLTVREYGQKTPFADQGNLISLKDKWNAQERVQYRLDP
ncbi:MAG: glycosyltransferase family 2 protein [Chitinophagaceae bacterium]